MKPGAGGRVALVHDWMADWGGAENVLQVLAGLFPEAPIYLGTWNPDPKGREVFGERTVRTTWLQRALPFVGHDHRRLLVAMPRAFRGLDLSDFDVVISSSHAFAKAVRVRPGARHICYCHTPPRYLWDLYGFYSPGWKGRLRAPVARWLRARDVEAARGVARFVANSRTVAGRIERSYGRAAEVVYPPVDLERFGGGNGTRGDYYLAGGRMVAYKRIDVAIEAANLGRFPLKVFGDGPDRGRLERLAGPTVELLGKVPDDRLPALVQGCRGYLFPAEEDFGILPVEVQAAGRPVVAWNRGGARETVVDGRTGVLVEECTPAGLLEGIGRLEGAFPDPEECRQNAVRFGTDRFIEGVKKLMSESAAERPPEGI